MKRSLPFIIIIVVLVAAVAVAWSLKNSATQPSAPRPAPSENSATPAASNSAHPGAQPPHVLGLEDAAVTLEEFGDFQCPPCGMLHPVLQTMEREFGPKLRLIFREYPLVPAHAHALSAARAAEAAGMQGKFWEMHGKLFDNQKAWKDAFDVRPIFEGYATEIDLNLDKYRQDVNSEAVAQRIFLDGKRAHALGVSGTPTVFMNGREVPFESLAPEKLRIIISTEIATRGK